MQSALLVFQFILAVALVGVILLQRTAQDGGGLMGGGNTMGGLFTARGSANLLTRATAILATIFILNSLALGFLASHNHQQGRNLVDQIAPAAPVPASAAPATGAEPVVAPATAPKAAAPAPAAKAPEAVKKGPAAAPEVPVAH